MKLRTVAAVLLLLTALLIPGTSQSNPKDLAGPIGPGGEELGAGGDDDSPSNSIDVPPSYASRNPPRTVTEVPSRTRSDLTSQIRQPSHGLMARLFRLPRLFWGKSDR